MLKVLGRTGSINVRKVLWTLEELDVPYKQEPWGGKERDPKVPEYLRLNPNGQVPTIIDDDFVLWESHAIMRYLEERDGRRRLLPADNRERAIAEQWLQWQATELNPQWHYAVYARIRNAPGYDDEDKVKASIVEWGKRMQMLEDRLAATGAFAGGVAFSLADISLGLSIHRWYAIPDDKPEFPLIGDYYERLRERPPGARYMAANLR